MCHCSVFLSLLSLSLDLTVSASLSLLFPFALIAGSFAHSMETNEWAKLCVMMAWVLLLRLGHFGMVYNSTRPYRNAMAVPPPPQAKHE